MLGGRGACNPILRNPTGMVQAGAAEDCAEPSAHDGGVFADWCANFASSIVAVAVAVAVAGTGAGAGAGAGAVAVVCPFVFFPGWGFDGFLGAIPPPAHRVMSFVDVHAIGD